MNLQEISKKLDAYERLMRLDKPIGILLLLWPTLWALWIASNGRPDWLILLIFITGTVLMRSAGCVMNDIADRNIDGHVERTKTRPLAAGMVNPKEAMWLAIILVILAFILVLFLNPKTRYLSVIALLLAATYPLTKRFFVMPQAYLGLAFGMGVPMAFAASNDYIPFFAWLMLLANVFWSVAYDTEYAMVDRDDDLKIGIKSSAITFGKYDVFAVMLSYILMLGLLGGIGAYLHMKWPYFVGLGVSAVIVVYHYYLIRHREKDGCFKAFLHNTWIGASVFLGIVAAYW